MRWFNDDYNLWKINGKLKRKISAEKCADIQQLSIGFKTKGQLNTRKENFFD